MSDEATIDMGWSKVDLKPYPGMPDAGIWEAVDRLKKELNMKTELAAQTFQPIGNLVIIQPIEVEKTKAGIVLPEYVRGRTDQSRPTEDAAVGLVVSAGALCKFVRRGDLVILNGKMPGFVHEGVKVAIGTEMQIVGIVRDADGKVPAFECTDWANQEVARIDRSNE